MREFSLVLAALILGVFWGFLAADTLDENEPTSPPVEASAPECDRLGPFTTDGDERELWVVICEKENDDA